MIRDRLVSVAGDSGWVLEIKETLLKRNVDLSVSLAPNFKRFEKWAQGYYRLPDKATLRAKLVEFGIVQNPDIVDLLISELASNSETEDDNPE